MTMPSKHCRCSDTGSERRILLWSITVSAINIVPVSISLAAFVLYVIHMFLGCLATT